MVENVQVITNWFNCEMLLFKNQELSISLNIVHISGFNIFWPKSINLTLNLSLDIFWSAYGTYHITTIIHDLENF
ncbi:unnamed protein product [Rhizophagus irregularis]|nr:unnamed protein product [Rhizophagus irregularis]CAB5363406.1 unnamed protein product [Rhizophagus irregularis]